MVASPFILPSGDGGQVTYDTVVDADGCCDFTSIAAAFAAGHRFVLVKSGIYVETKDIIIPASGRLVSDGVGSVIVDLSSGAKVKTDGSGRQTSTGTIDFTNGSNIVTGIGTSFTSLLPGDYIALNGAFYLIAVISDDENLLLANAYQGTTQSGIAMLGQSMIRGASVERINFVNAPEEAILLRQVEYATIEKCLISASGDTGIGAVRLVDAWACLIFGVVIEFAGGDGFELNHVFGCRLESCATKGCADAGLNVRNGTRLLMVSNSIFMHNGAQGVRVGAQGGDSPLECVFESCQAIQNADVGFQTDDGAKFRFDACHACSNGSHGISLAGADDGATDCLVKANAGTGIIASDRAVIGSCNVSLNGSLGIDAAGKTDTVIEGNVVWQNTGIGIRGGPNNSIVGNNLHDGSAAGIVLPAAADDTIVSGNRSRDHTTDGIRIEAGATDCIVTSNNAKGNTGTNILNSGTGTTLANNKT